MSRTLNGKPRLRERTLMSGPAAFSDAELLALLLGTGADGCSALALSTALLDAAGGLAGIRRLGAHGLASHRGVGPAKAARIVAALELGHRATFHELSERVEVLTSFEAVVRWARPRLGTLDHEEVWLLALDGKNGLRSATRVAQGGVHGCALTPRDVLRPAVRDSASAIILLHNHPSGDPTPSIDDVTMTSLLASACEVVGIQLLDHVVIARGGATSLRDSGALGD